MPYYLLYLDLLLDPQPVKAVLQDLEVVNEINFRPGIPFYLVEGDFFGVGCIEELAVDVAGPELLYFGEGEQEDVVEPVDDVEAGGGGAFRS